MRRLTGEAIAQAVERLCVKANMELRADVLAALQAARQTEQSDTGREVLGRLVANADVAARNRVPICQDCGTVTVFARVGCGVSLEGALGEAVDDGVRRAYAGGVLRASMVAEPLFERANTSDNTPAALHCESVAGDRLELTVMPKGAGSDNKSRLIMLRPTDDPETIGEFVCQVVDMAGADACPPLVVGVGAGGTFDTVGLLAKKALLRAVGTRNADTRAAGLEETWLARVNGLGIGPAGLGGRTTALAVHLEMAPTHMGTLPVAVDLSCHALRGATETL